MRFAHVALPCVACSTLLVAACNGSGQQAATTTASGGAGTSTTAVSTTATTSSSGTGGADAGDEMASTNYPAPHPSTPHVVTLGGPVIASPKLVPVFFSDANVTERASAIDFLSRVGATDYWAATTSEYGVGPAVALAPVLLTEAAPGSIDDTAIQAWLATNLAPSSGTGGGGTGGAGGGATDAGAEGGDADAGAGPVWPAPDANTLYVLHYPGTTRITLDSGTSCENFGGYHNSASVNGQNVAYAVIPTCSDFDGLHGINAITGAASHELIEAVTDPYPQVDPAYVEPDDAHVFWEAALGGGEVGDMCAQFPGVFTTFAELPYKVQRTWSNASASAGHDPCVPELPGEVYFNAAPALTDAIPSNVGEGGDLRGVKVPLGQTRTIDVDLFSEGDAGGPWNVSVTEGSAFVGGTSSLSLVLDQPAGQNGDVLHLSITANAAGPYYGMSFFVVTSSNANLTTEWIGVVAN